MITEINYHSWAVSTFYFLYKKDIINDDVIKEMATTLGMSIKTSEKYVKKFLNNSLLY